MKFKFKWTIAFLSCLGLVSCGAGENQDPSINTPPIEIPGDNDDDHNNDNFKIDENGNLIVNGVNTKIKLSEKNLAISNVYEEELDGTKYTCIVLSDGTTLKVPMGVDGKDGNTPYIQDNYRYIDGKNTGVPTTNGIELRVNGDNIEWKTSDSDSWSVLISLDLLKGQDGIDGNDGQDGEDGKTPYIGENGNWWIDGQDTGVKGSGNDGTNGNDGQDGENGKTPYIGENGNWWIGDQDTGVKASAKDGEDGESIYDLYVKYVGFEGSEEQFIQDLISGKLLYNDPGKIDYVPEINVRVTAGEKINLPTEILVYYTSGINVFEPVSWAVNDLNTDFLGYKVIKGFVDGYNSPVTCNLRVVNYSSTDMYIDGYINGILENDVVDVTLVGSNYVYTTSPSYNGYYKFDNLAEGNYTIKVDVNNYDAVLPQTATIETVGKDESKIYKNVSHNNFYLSSIREKDTYYYIWRLDDNAVSYETSASINEKINVEFLDENDAEISDDGSATLLREKYNVVLDNSQSKWTPEISSRFLQLYSTFPDSVTSDLKSVWKLTSNELLNDIEITKNDEYYEVTVSKSAIANMTPRAASIDGIQGEYFSNRFYAALLRFVTDNGNNAEKCETILTTNFLTSFNVPDYEELTSSTTQETAACFQEFLPEEKIQIITMFEEMPKGMHKMKELKYLVRRKSGTKNPIYPEAAAVTWTLATEPYIEFMDSTFDFSTGYYDTKRLIIHEKSHMFYEYYFSDELKANWIEIGGWYEDPNDPDGWSTTKQTEFVSAYAHQHNPDEDMAESMATYIINPDLLRSRSINKYNFIRNYIMQGDIYLTSIREDLTFEVYNISPDYIYPGKINSIVVKITGNEFEDKLVDISMTLLGEDETYGAENFWFRLLPSDINVNQFYDFSGSKVDSSGLSLRGNMYFSKYSYSGYYLTDQITLKDKVGNERYSGINDFSMKVFIKNPLEDLECPVYHKGTLSMEVTSTNNAERPGEQLLTIRGKVTDNVGIKRILVRLLCLGTDKASIDVDASVLQDENNYFTTEIIIPSFYSTGTYEIQMISIDDIATNNSRYNINYDEFKDENRSIYIETPNPDNEKPVLDVNNIKVEARPSNPTTPNGETFVNITITISDNLSGVRIGYLKLIDPQGLLHSDWIYFEGVNHGGTYSPFEDNTIPRTFTIKRTLPAGSAPGIWGIYEISLTDFAENSVVYNFAEIVHFEVK